MNPPSTPDQVIAESVVAEPLDELLRQTVNGYFVLTDGNGAVSKWSEPAELLFGIPVHQLAVGGLHLPWREIPGGLPPVLTVLRPVPVQHGGAHVAERLPGLVGAEAALPVSVLRRTVRAAANPCTCQTPSASRCTGHPADRSRGTFRWDEVSTSALMYRSSGLGTWSRCG